VIKERKYNQGYLAMIKSKKNSNIVKSKSKHGFDKISESEIKV